MNGYITTILLISFLCGDLQAHNLKNGIKEERKEKTCTTHDAMSFFQKNKNDLSLYKSLHVVFELWHENEYDHNLWKGLAGSFCNLAACCENSGLNPDDESWLSLMGPFFKKLHDSYINDKTGIHGNISIQLQDEKIKCVVSVNHREDYDTDAWQSLVNTGIHLAQRFSDVNESENIAWLQKNIPIIGNAISVAGDNSGIHGLLEVKISDTTNNMGMGYTG